MSIWELNLRQLKAAIAIRDLGSISEAAKAVHISQPAITQGLAKMEQSIGQPLFVRTPSGMHQSEAGALFLPRAQSALAFIESPRVTMTQVKAMVALADAGSYARAALSTGLSQPSLHRAVRDLSIALKAPLFDRRGRGIALTDKGRRVARRLRLAKAELEAGFEELATLRGQDGGTVRIGAMPLSRVSVLPTALTMFRKTNSHARATIVEGAFHELIDPLLDGEIDLMIGAMRDPALNPEVQQRLLFQDWPAVIGRAGHPALSGALTWEDLGKFDWIIPPHGTPLRSQWETAFTDAKLPLPDVPIECGSVITIRQLLLESDCLTLLSPAQVALELRYGVLETIAKAPQSVVRDIGLIQRAGWRATANQEQFIHALEQAVPLQ